MPMRIKLLAFKAEMHEPVVKGLRLCVVYLVRDTVRAIVWTTELCRETLSPYHLAVNLAYVSWWKLQKV